MRAADRCLADGDVGSRDGGFSDLANDAQASLVSRNCRETLGQRQIPEDIGLH